MKCPKCNNSISPYDFYCNKCGKILKIECPRCGTINTSFVCSKCKLQLVTKCKICDTKNHVTVTRCRKCKGKIVTNPKIQDAYIHKFAAVCIEFKNLAALKSSMGGNTYDEFIQKLHKFIEFKTLKDISNYKFISNELLSVSFSKNYTISESCNSAVEFAKQIFEFLNDVNDNLEKMSYDRLKVKIALTIVNLFDRRTLARTERSVSTNDDIEIVAHPTIYKYAGDNYKFKHLVTVEVNNNYTQFYGIIFDPPELSETSNLPGMGKKQEKEKSGEEKVLPFIKFAGKKNHVLPVSQSKLSDSIEEIITNRSTGAFINVSGDINSGKLLLVNEDNLTKNMPDPILIRTTCTEDSKFYPFNLFRNIIRSFLGLDQIFINSEGESELVKNKLYSILNFHAEELLNIIYLEQGETVPIPELRDNVFLQIYNLLFALSRQNKLIIMVDDFENVDRGSLDCLNYLVERNILKEDIFFIVSTDQGYSLSKVLSGIYKYENYYKMLLQADKIQDVRKYLSHRIQNIKNNNFIEKIIQSSQNSLFYIDQAIYYLLENNIVKYEAGELKIFSESIIPVPTSLEKLIKRRSATLINDNELLKSYLTLILLGEKISTSIFKVCIEEYSEKNLKKLAMLGLIKYSGKEFINVKNYNLMRKSILNAVDKAKLAAITENIYLKLMLNENFLHPINFKYLEYMNDPKESLKILNHYAQLCSKLGDISAFICCLEKFNAEIDKNIREVDKDRLQQVNMVKLDCYEQIGDLAYTLYPETTFNFLEKAIALAEKLNDQNRITKLSGINAYCCTYIGNYKKSLYYINKIFSSLPKENFDVNSSEFDIKLYILNFIKIQALFNTGKLNKCIELSERVLKVLEIVKQKDLFTEIISLDFIEKITVDIRFFVIKSGLILLNDRSAEFVKDFAENNIAFEILSLGKDFINGTSKDIYNKISAYNRDLDPETSLLYAVFAVLYNLRYGNTQEAANIAYSHKQTAVNLMNYQVTYFFDLIIGIAYKEIENLPKAKIIYEDVLRLSTEKNLSNIFFMSWYLIADLELYKGNVENALEIVNNVNIMLEKDQNISKIFSIYFKHLLSRIFAAKNDPEYVIKFEEQAIRLAVKYGLNYNAVCYSRNLTEVVQNLLKDEKDAEKIERLEEKIRNILSELNLLEDEAIL